MSQTETIFNPLNDSLAERVRAYQSVCQAYSHVQANAKQVEREGSVGYIGDVEEVQSAFDTIQKSFKQATQKVSSADLQLAKQQGLLSDKQLQDIVQLQRAQEMTEKRQNKSDHSDSLNLKR